MLREYQSQMLRNIMSDLEEKPELATVSIAATGTGKGNVIGAVAQALYAARSRPPVIMAPTEEIVDQLAQHVQHAFSEDVPVGIEQGKRSTTSASARAIVASLKTFESGERRAQVLDRVAGGISGIICDEAHHFATPLRRDILKSLGYGRLPTLGFTATFDRSYAARELLDLFPRVAFAYHTLDAIRDGWITDVRPTSIETGISLRDVRSGSGDYNQEKLVKTINIKKRNALAIDVYQEHIAGSNMRVIAFCGDVEHANTLSEMFRSAGVESESLTTECPVDKRDDIIDRFRSGALPVVTAYGIPLEGFDTDAHAILWLRPTLLEHLFQQGLGRVVRPPLDAMEQLNALETAQERRALIRDRKGDAQVFEFLDEDPERASERAGSASLAELRGDFLFDGKDALTDICRYAESVISLDAKQFMEIRTSEQLRKQHLSPSQHLIGMTVHSRADREASLPPVLTSREVTLDGALIWNVMGPGRYATAVIEADAHGQIVRKTVISLTRFGSIWVAQCHEGRQIKIIGSAESMDKAALLSAHFADSRNVRQHHRLLNTRDEHVRAVIEAELRSTGYDRQAVAMLSLDPAHAAERYEDVEEYTFLEETINAEDYTRSLQEEARQRTKDRK